MVPLHLMLAALIRSIAGDQQKGDRAPQSENRVLKTQLRGRRGRLSDAERRRLALLGARLGRPILTGIRVSIMSCLTISAASAPMSRLAVSAPRSCDWAHATDGVSGHYGVKE
jgi:hypothetical protein